MPFTTTDAFSFILRAWTEEVIIIYFSRIFFFIKDIFLQGRVAGRRADPKGTLDIVYNDTSDIN